MLDTAIMIAATAFEGKHDKGGQPYILHCLAVMYQIPEEEPQLRIAAVLHDLFEDCPDDWDFERLIRMGFEAETVMTIETITHHNGESYENYIKRINLCPHLNFGAKRIKKADLRHNSDILRMKGLRAKDFARLEKYHKAYQYLS